MSGTYIQIEDALAQLSLDEGLQAVYERRVNLLIGGAEDWAENFTERTLGELMILDNQAKDSNAKATPDPKQYRWAESDLRPRWYDEPCEGWQPENWRYYWQCNPIQGTSDTGPARRDIYCAILLYMESLFDRNTDNFELLEQRAISLLMPYRRGMGV